jgi:hypothetical protein
MGAVEWRIVGFHQDTEGDWVAELDCGHRQHVRHRRRSRSGPGCSTRRTGPAASARRSIARSVTGRSRPPADARPTPQPAKKTPITSAATDVVPATLPRCRAMPGSSPGRAATRRRLGHHDGDLGADFPLDHHGRA